MAADSDSECGHFPLVYICSRCFSAICRGSACIERHSRLHSFEECSVHTNAVAFVAGSTGADSAAARERMEIDAAKAAVEEAARPQKKSASASNQGESAPGQAVLPVVTENIRRKWCITGTLLAKQIRTLYRTIPITTGSSLNVKVAFKGYLKDRFPQYPGNDSLRAAWVPEGKKSGGHKSVFLTIGLRRPTPESDDTWLALIVELGILAQADSGQTYKGKRNVSVAPGAVTKANRPELKWPYIVAHDNVGVLLPRDNMPDADADAAAAAATEHDDLAFISENGFLKWTFEVFASVSRSPLSADTIEIEDRSGGATVKEVESNYFVRKMSYVTVSSQAAWLPRRPRAVLVRGSKDAVLKYTAEWGGKRSFHLELIRDEMRDGRVSGELRAIAARPEEGTDSRPLESSIKLFTDVLSCGGKADAAAAVADEAYRCCLLRAVDAAAKPTEADRQRAAAVLARIQLPHE